MDIIRGRARRFGDNIDTDTITPASSLHLPLEGLKKHAFERDRSLVGEGTAASSRLWKLLKQPGGHGEARLDADSLNRLATWMDTYAQRVGHFSDEQEKQLAAFRASLAGLWEHPDPPR